MIFRLIRSELWSYFLVWIKHFSVWFEYFQLNGSIFILNTGHSGNKSNSFQHNFVSIYICVYMYILSIQF